MKYEQGQSSIIRTMGGDQEFYLSGQLYRIHAERDGGRSPLQRKYTVWNTGRQSIHQIPVDVVIIRQERFFTRRRALSAARERMTGQLQHKISTGI